MEEENNLFDRSFHRQFGFIAVFEELSLESMMLSIMVQEMNFLFEIIWFLEL